MDALWVRLLCVACASWPSHGTRRAIRSFSFFSRVVGACFEFQNFLNFVDFSRECPSLSSFLSRFFCSSRSSEFPEFSEFLDLLDFLGWIP